jgi:hypothetical protein
MTTQVSLAPPPYGISPAPPPYGSAIQVAENRCSGLGIVLADGRRFQFPSSLVQVSQSQSNEQAASLPLQERHVKPHNPYRGIVLPTDDNQIWEPVAARIQNICNGWFNFLPQLQYQVQKNLLIENSFDAYEKIWTTLWMHRAEMPVAAVMQIMHAIFDQIADLFLNSNLQAPEEFSRFGSEELLQSRGQVAKLLLRMQQSALELTNDGNSQHWMRVFGRGMRVLVIVCHCLSDVDREQMRLLVDGVYRIAEEKKVPLDSEFVISRLRIKGTSNGEILTLLKKYFDSLILASPHNRKQLSSNKRYVLREIKKKGLIRLQPETLSTEEQAIYEIFVRLNQWDP